MSALLIGSASALWSGILTSVSPCPLATNIAAVSFVGRRVGSPAGVVFSGLLYAAGRALAYAVIGAALVGGLLSAPGVSQALQEHFNKFLGPLLIVVGMVLLGLIRFPVPSCGLGERIRKRAETWGVLGALPLGAVFALSFCPVSAAWFFGSLMPLAFRLESGVLLPSVYGIGTALPVIAFATPLALGVGAAGRAFHDLSRVELWARRLAGVLLVVIGVRQALIHVFRLPVP